ncbi:RDD family protein [Microbulbifer sp. YPW1]|uniref:RDD family protein n=1 Tax=Microbulbifer sp. YPW1 TaxID=2745199 RepID=UPI00159AA2CE|nr:RDD family protein [Microbulbifer sp. YPW1]QKX17758.1 RDD family protein [Microbulbifer sp. YPW1]
MKEEKPFKPLKSVAGEPDNLTRLASRSSRLIATLIDSATAAFLLFPLLWFILLEEARVGNITVLRMIICSLVIGILSYALVNAYYLHKKGQSFGKMYVGIRVIGSKSGQVIPFYKYFLLRILPIIIVIFPIFIGLIIIIIDSLFIFRKDKRCLHDLLTGTLVVNVNEK